MTTGNPSRWQIVRGPLLVWIALLGLLTVTAVCAYIPLGYGNVMLSTIIGIVKAILIVVFFMRLATSSRTIVLAGLAGIAFLFTLFLLTFGDYLTRVH